jgi:antitoxin HigA-1
MKRIMTHPGTILREEFMAPLSLSVNALAIALRVPATRIDAIVKGKRSVTADTALRLGRYFGTTSLFWLNLQTHYDMTKAMAESGSEIEREVRPRAA